jgi:hypothetical protein
VSAGADKLPEDDLDDIPRLPRGRGLRLSRPQLVRIGGTLMLLVFMIAMQKPCSSAVSKFVTGFGSDGSAAATLPKPGTVDLPSGSAAAPASPELRLDQYEHLRPGMTDDEVRAVIERAKHKANAASGSASGNAASGSASGNAAGSNAAGTTTP